MIPKKIHYVWFGEVDKPDSVKKCIASWRKYLPDYEIIEWNEKTFNIDSSNFVKQALDSNMYAFASDYVRLWAVYHYGGIYMDTDVEIIRNYDDLLRHKVFFGTEEVDSINSGLSFGAEMHNTTIKKLMKLYDGMEFVNFNGTLNLKTTNTVITEYFIGKGYKLSSRIQKVGDAVIYPRQYFSPLKWWNGKMEIQPLTYSIHWYDASWLDNNVKHKNMSRMITVLKHYIVLMLRKSLGYFGYRDLKQLFTLKRY